MSEVQTAGQNLTEFFSMQWVDVLSALLTPTIAGIAIFIAYQQLLINRANLREKLFERRMAVFNEAHAFVSEVVRYAACDDNLLRKFTGTYQRSRFLFGSEIWLYLEAIRREAIDLQYYQGQIERLPLGEERSEFVQRDYEIMIRFSGHLREIFDRFEPFLGFKENG